MKRWVTIGLMLLGFQHDPAETREVFFTSEAIELAGSLVLPEGSGPHPAAVFVHGSGPHTRAGPVEMAATFTDTGVALLAFDKRGTGESGGDWTRASIHDLGADVAAAVAFLRRQPEIDPDQVGLWGVSQGGWIAPLVIADDPEIAFLVVVSGGGVTPLASELFSYDNAFRHAALTAGQQAEAFEVLGRYFRYMASGEGYDGLKADLDTMRDRPWYAHASLHRVLPSPANRPYWSWVADFDPLLSIAAVRCPVLLVFGDQDRQQPTDRAVERWRQGLRLAGNDSLTVRIFEGANHGLRVAGSGHHGGDYVAGYPAVITQWLKSKVVQSPPP